MRRSYDSRFMESALSRVMRLAKPGFRFWPGIFLLLSMCCKKEEIVPEPYRPTNAHEAYLHSLQRAQLVGTALGRDGLAAHHRGLHQALSISTPYQESLYVDQTQP